MQPADIKREKAFTLIEVLVGTLILAAIGIPTLQMFVTSKVSISRSDVRRDVRYYVQEIFAHASRQSLHTLWCYYGPKGLPLPARIVNDGVVLYDPPDGISGRMDQNLADVDPDTGKIMPGDSDPLGFGQAFLDELDRDGYRATLHFEFYTRKELQLPELDPATADYTKKDPASPFGLLWMQAGWVQIELYDKRASSRSSDPDGGRVCRWRQPMMCPAIVGRPGLKLSSCPAIAPQIRQSFGPIVARSESQRSI